VGRATALIAPALPGGFGILAGRFSRPDFFKRGIFRVQFFLSGQTSALQIFYSQKFSRSDFFGGRVFAFIFFKAGKFLRPDFFERQTFPAQNIFSGHLSSGRKIAHAAGPLLIITFPVFEAGKFSRPDFFGRGSYCDRIFLGA